MGVIPIGAARMIRWDVPRVIEAATSCNESSNIITISAASYVESMCVDVCLEGRIVGRVVKGKFVRGAWCHSNKRTWFATARS